MMRRLGDNHHAVLWAIFALAFLLRAWGLPSQPPTDDEVGSASAAFNYLENGLFGQVMWYHPPLRNIVILVASKLAGGYTAWGLRGGSLLFGSATVPLLGYLVHGLFGRKNAAYLAALFLCIDPLHIYLSRAAFQETTTSFFIAAGTIAGLHAVRRNNILLCYLSGILFGTASASKWNGLFPWAVTAAAYLIYPWLSDDRKDLRRPASRFLTAGAAFVAVPVVVYTATYIPWLLKGYSLPDLAGLQLWLVKHQYHWKGTPYTEEVLSHRAYQWFLWPVAWVDFVFHQGKAYLGIAMGNYLSWVLTLPSCYFAVREWLRTRTFELGYVFVIFTASYLPLILTTRSIWVFIATPLILFAFTLSSYAIDALLERRSLSAKAVIIYLSAVVAVSAIMYPMATFEVLEHPWMQPLADLYTPH